MCQNVYFSIQGLANPCTRSEAPKRWYFFKGILWVCNVLLILAGLSSAFAYTVHVGHLAKSLLTWKQFVIFAASESTILLLKFFVCQKWEKFELRYSGTHISFWLHPAGRDVSLGLQLSARALSEGALQVSDGKWIVRLANISQDISEHAGLLRWNVNGTPMVTMPWTVIAPEHLPVTKMGKYPVICFEKCVHNFSSRLGGQRKPQWQILRKDGVESRIMIGLESLSGDDYLCPQCNSEIHLADAQTMIQTHSLDTKGLKAADRHNANVWELTLIDRLPFVKWLELSVPTAEDLQLSFVDLYLPLARHDTTTLRASIDRSKPSYLHAIRDRHTFAFRNAQEV